MRKKLEGELKRLADLDIIDNEKLPTPLISVIFIVPKKNNITRICVDMRQPDCAKIEHEI